MDKRCSLKHKGLGSCRGPLHRHHILYRSELPKHPERDNPRNLITVCSLHHKRFHDKKNRREPRVKERKLRELYKVAERYKD